MYPCIKLLWFKPTQFDLVALILSHTQRELFLFPKMTSQLEKGGEGGGRSPSESLPLPRAEGAGRALKAGISCWVSPSPLSRGLGILEEALSRMGSASWEDLERHKLWVKPQGCLGERGACREPMRTASDSSPKFQPHAPHLEAIAPCNPSGGATEDSFVKWKKTSS